MLGSLVGYLLGEAFAGQVSEIYIRWRPKRNGGVFAPEMRLHPTLPGLIMVPFGLAGFDICVQHKTHWLVPVSMIAITILGYKQTVSLGMANGIDCSSHERPTLRQP
ncbi:hypothetical protein LTR85_003737 [Meristemomyces frigidus]|nr:hypothetical protein LTR85_003737 [Meristemomyces frigidus]